MGEALPVHGQADTQVIIQYFAAIINQKNRRGILQKTLYREAKDCYNSMVPI
jgi:hypothetical protein